eukprot:6938767-Pyramimonas_sp.AAC.1
METNAESGNSSAAAAPAFCKATAPADTPTQNCAVLTARRIHRSGPSALPLLAAVAAQRHWPQRARH